MQNANGHSFLLVTNAPEELNFAMYVACSFELFSGGLSFDKKFGWSAYRRSISDKEERTFLSNQWYDWWCNLVNERARMYEYESKGDQNAFYSHDGKFGFLESQFSLLCNEAWPSFKEWWGMAAGGQQGVNYWDKASEFHNVVKRVEADIRRDVKPGRLIVDYVYTGLNSILTVKPSYAIMSVHNPGETIYNDEWWVDKVRELG